MSVIQAKGHSMEPLIHDGDLCLFEFYGTDSAGSKEGKIVLAKDIHEEDSAYEGRFTIKTYHRASKDLIELRPKNRDYPVLTISSNDIQDSENPIKAVYIEVLK